MDSAAASKVCADGASPSRKWRKHHPSCRDTWGVSHNFQIMDPSKAMTIPLSNVMLDVTNR